MSERTEAPTGKRVSEARQEGRVIRSQEINSALVMVGGVFLLQGPGQGLVNVFKQMIIHHISALPDVEITQESLSSLVVASLAQVLPPIGTILVGILAVGVVATMAQTGFLWASKKVGFDFSRLNPLPGFKRIFSSQGIFEMLKALVKLLLVGWAVYSFLNAEFSKILQLAQMNLAASLSSWTSLALNLGLRVGEIYLILAVADYAYQRWQYNKSMKMTKEEVKEELKQMEGDPFLKNRIRSQQRRMARMRMMANVKKADVVITNPTHLAVAVQYDPKTMHAPKVLAKGAHLTAQRIADLARSNGIPVIQNIPLARAMYKTVEIEQEIPPELYIAMAEVLSYVYKMRGSSPVTTEA